MPPTPGPRVSRFQMGRYRCDSPMIWSRPNCNLCWLADRRKVTEYVFAIDLDQLSATRLFSPPAVAVGAVVARPAVMRGRKRWRMRSIPFTGRLSHIGLPELVARVLEVRGVASRHEAELF